VPVMVLMQGPSVAQLAASLVLRTPLSAITNLA
jgi:hypothetical protein